MSVIFRSDLPDMPVGGGNLAAVVLDACRQHPSRLAVVDDTTGQRVTYGELAHHADRIGAWFTDRGYGRGDVVAVWAPNIAPWVSVAVGAMAARCAVTGISPLATDPEAAQQLTTSRARALVTFAPFAARAIALRQQSAVQDVIVLGEGTDGAVGLGELIGCRGASPDVEAITEDSVAMLPFSSGTTGAPKGVQLTHRCLVTMLRQLATTVQPTPDDVMLALPPFPHIMGSVLTMLLPLSAGATVVTTARFDPARFVPSIGEHGITVVVVPPMLASLFAHHPAATAEAFASVRLIAFGGAPLSAEAEQAVAARYPHVLVGQGWGMTELAVGATTPRVGDVGAHGSVGKLLPNTELRVVDPATGDDMGIDGVGELLVRGPQVMAGYLDRDDATAATIDADGWVHTGDLGRIDADGMVWVVDRIKDLIKVKGFQVAPAELEAVLQRHPGVADAAVIRSVVDDQERPLALVVPRGELDVEALRTWCNEQVAPYKRIDEVRVVEVLPRNPSGKLLRRELTAV
jgi:acyl-CoA synthetase (AMP-forming)/AMP-acid ligase II